MAEKFLHFFGCVLSERQLVRLEELARPLRGNKSEAVRRLIEGTAPREEDPRRDDDEAA